MYCSNSNVWDEFSFYSCSWIFSDLLTKQTHHSIWLISELLFLRCDGYFSVGTSKFVVDFKEKTDRNAIDLVLALEYLLKMVIFIQSEKNSVA